MTASPTDAAQLPPEDVSQSEVIREVARPDAVEKVCGTILPPPIFRRDPCRYFMAGECWYGASCHYSHDVEQPKQKLAADGRPLCSFHLKGVCMRGSACRFSHDEDTILGIYSSASTCPSLDSMERVTCGICLEDFSVRGGAAERESSQHAPEAEGYKVGEAEGNMTCDRSSCGAKLGKGSKVIFGILPGCDHAFCITCIKAWRSSGSLSDDRRSRRACPVCRVPSDFVVPCFYFCRDVEKAALIQRFRASRAKIPCRYFSQSGFCPFRDDCMFGHVTADGKTVEGVQAPPKSRGRKPSRESLRGNEWAGVRLRDMLRQVMQAAGPEQNENIMELIEQLAAMQYDDVFIMDDT